MGSGKTGAENAQLRVVIVMGVRLYRDGLASVLDAHDGIQVVARAADWRDALPLVSRHHPDVVLVDLPAVENRGVVRQLAAAGDRRACVVALSITGSDDVVRWAEAGVAGYVTREDSLEDLITVVESVVRDEMPCSPRAAAMLIRRVGMLAADRQFTATRLTAREREIVMLMERGLSNKEIGRSLSIQVATVKNHVHNILDKLQVSSRSDAVALVQGRAARQPVAGRRP
jgi:DNA-binding NarL/FixJ family response regulator